MSYKIRFEKGSLSDFQEGVRYYETISEELVKRFHAEFWNTIDKIKSNPLHYQKRYRNIRIVFTENFPFGIHYFIENEMIYVLRVLHTKRFFKT